MSAEDTAPKMDNSAPGTEAELEAFRRQWREEVSARNKKPEEPSRKDHDRPGKERERQQSDASRPTVLAGPSTARRKDDYSEEIAPRTYHDLPDKEEQLQLGVTGQNHDRDLFKEPSSALEHYERAVEKETQGNLSESMRHYRRAFKLDDGVHEAYKRKHFPPSSFKPKPPASNPPNKSEPGTGTAQPTPYAATTAPPSSTSLIDSFSTLRLEPPPPPTDASPPEKCPIAELPEELLTQILTTLAILDIASFAPLSQVCKRLAYLIHSEQTIWKRVALGPEWGFGGMHYDYACSIEGTPLSPYTENPHLLAEEHEVTVQKREAPLESRTEELLRTTYANSWRNMFRSRPRLRFGGVYISTVNYTRAGGPATNTLTWGAPVHVVTYFRYLRFFRDGSLISLLTTSEPADVVHHLTKQNMHGHHGHSLLPSVVMKDALSGRWRLTGSQPTRTDDGEESGEMEEEGEVCIETQGVVPKYVYVMRLVVSSAGRKEGTRGNKLAWKGFWSWNRISEDWGRFELRGDKAFYWSRVRSFE